MPVFNHFGLTNNQEILDLLIQIVGNGNQQVELLQSLKAKALEPFNFSGLSEILSNSLPSLSLQEKEGYYDSPVVLNIGSEPVKIVEENSYNLISLSNIGQHKCWLKFGSPPTDSSDFHLPIPPAFNALKFETNSQGIYLFSKSDEITQIVYSNFIESNNTGEATKIMKIKPFFATGSVNYNEAYGWPWWVESEMNSGIAGFKLFSFEAPNPLNSYNFNLDPGAIAYKPTTDYPINIYLLGLNSLLQIHLYTSQFNNPNVRVYRDAISFAKKKSWAAKLPATGGSFQLVPSHSFSIGLIDLQIDGNQWAETAVFNFRETDNTFTIEGV